MHAELVGITLSMNFPTVSKKHQNVKESPASNAALSPTSAWEGLPGHSNLIQRDTAQFTDTETIYKGKEQSNILLYCCFCPSVMVQIAF